jgi:thiol-disulfide isomerase/thioredoxin
MNLITGYRRRSSMIQKTIDEVRLTWSFVFCGLIVGMIGCHKSDSATSSTAGTGQSGGTLAVQNHAVELQIRDYAKLQQLIAEKRGKVVVVDAWSTSCPPCVKSFPDLVALQQKIGPERLACISLSLDYDGSSSLDRVAPMVVAFLKKQQATFDNVLASEEIFAMLRKLGVSSPPAVFVYDRTGKLREKFTETSSKGRPVYEQVEELVGQLLAEAG